MRYFVTKLFIVSGLALMLVNDALAVRIMTSPSTAFGDPALQFDNFALTPDGNTIVATGLFNAALTGDRVYSLPVPADPVNDTSAITQLSTAGFGVDQSYDVAFAPVISPNGLTILYTHDNSTPLTNTIYTMPIAGEIAAPSFTGLFGPDPNLATPGDQNSHPIYSGTDVFFLNNNAGFNGGAIPVFPSSPVPWAKNPDWDRIYKRDSGGVVTAVTAPGDGDIDAGLFTVTPNGSSIVYAPDNPIIEGKDRGGIRPSLFTISTSGGAATEIPLTAPAHDFTIARQLEVTSDGQTVLFIADYEVIGKNELFSVPIAGGTPTRVSDDIPWSGDVSSFALAPNGLSVAYIAGQNNGANSEVFQTPIAGGTGNSIRVSDPAPSNSGAFDASTSVEGGQIAYSNDSTEIYYLGDLNTDEVDDLYVVDTTAKAGLVPSPYYYTGPSGAGSDFFNESFWNDQANGSGNSPPASSITPGEPIRHTLIIDGDTVNSGTAPGGAGREADFQVGGSLELTPGSVLNFPESNDELDFNPGSGFKVTNATVSVFEDILLEGTNVFSGGVIESLGDDVEFQDGHKTSIDGTIIRSVVDNLVFDNSLTSVTGATFVSNDRLGLRYEVDVTVTGTTSIDVNGGLGDVEDIFAGAQGDGSTLTLDGASTLLANAIQDGVDLVLDGTSVATLLGNSTNCNSAPGQCDLADPTSTITLMSTGAELITLNPSATDVRALVINGITGLSYLADPNAWNFTTWDGISTLSSLKLAAGLAGDFDFDDDVDGDDFLLWQRGLSPTPNSPSDLADWEANYGTTLPAVSAGATTIPEPSSIALLLVGLVALSTEKRRRKSIDRLL